jgi:hypothetical protein
MMPHMPTAKARELMKIPEPVMQFDITPDPSARQKLWWHVKVFKTRVQMRRYLRLSRPDWPKSVVDKIWAFTDEKNMEILFCLYTCTDNCVSHECLHAVNWWLPTAIGLNLRRALDWGTNEHEMAAEALGSMVSQFWKGFVEAGQKRTECWGFEKIS